MNLKITFLMAFTAFPAVYMAALKETDEGESDRTPRQAIGLPGLGGTLGMLLGNLASPLESQLQNAGTMLLSSGVNQLGLNAGGSTLLTNTLGQLIQSLLARDTIQPSLGQYRVSTIIGPGNRPVLILSPTSPNLKPIILPISIRDILNGNQGYNNIINGNFGLGNQAFGNVFNDNGLGNVYNNLPLAVFGHSAHSNHDAHGAPHHFRPNKVHGSKPGHLKKPEKIVDVDQTEHDEKTYSISEIGPSEIGAHHEAFLKNANQRPNKSEDILNTMLGKNTSDSTEEFYPKIQQF